MCARVVSWAVVAAALLPVVAWAHDTDGDGIEDEWEIIYGFDPLDPADGALDLDGDGLDNLAEFLGLTNPYVFDGPTAPTADAPLAGAETVATPDLSVLNATDPSGDALLYTWEVYSDELLITLVTGATGIVEGGAGLTSWQVDLTLAENTPYWWRARANDPFVGGAWTATSWFFVNEANDPPSAPTPATPQDGELLPSLSPTIQLGASTDADGDAISYGIEVWADASLTALLTSTTGLIESGGLVEWTVDVAMTEDAWGWLRARATDEHGLAGPWTATIPFHVSGEDAAPDGLVWIGPVDGQVVGTRSPVLAAGGATDAEGAAVSYSFEVSDDGSWADAWASDPISADGTGAAQWDLDGAGVQLPENGVASARVRASDGAIWSPWVAASFFIDATNEPPGSPELVAPDDGADIGEARPVDLVASWSADPDRDRLAYTFVLARDQALTDVLASVVVPGGNTAIEDPGEAVWPLTEDLEAGTYWWSAMASDVWGLGSGFAAPRGVVVPEVEIPTPPPGGYSFGDREPKDCGCTASLGGGSAAWWAALAGLALLLRRRRRGRPIRSARSTAPVGVKP